VQRAQSAVESGCASSSSSMALIASGTSAEEGAVFDADNNTTELLDLPDHLLLDVLAQLDPASICGASRSCTRLCALAAHPTLWPHAASDDGAVLRQVRRALARSLRIPPQAFTCALDLDRSRQFPVCAPTFGLRQLLRVVDPDSVAASISLELQVGSGFRI